AVAVRERAEVVEWPVGVASVRRAGPRRGVLEGRLVLMAGTPDAADEHVTPRRPEDEVVAFAADQDQHAAAVEVWAGPMCPGAEPAAAVRDGGTDVRPGRERGPLGRRQRERQDVGDQCPLLKLSQSGGPRGGDDRPRVRAVARGERP